MALINVQGDGFTRLFDRFCAQTEMNHTVKQTQQQWTTAIQIFIPLIEYISVSGVAAWCDVLCLSISECDLFASVLHFLGAYHPSLPYIPSGWGGAIPAGEAYTSKQLNQNLFFHLKNTVKIQLLAPHLSSLSYHGVKLQIIFQLSNISARLWCQTCRIKEQVFFLVCHFALVFQAIIRREIHVRKGQDTNAAVALIEQNTVHTHVILHFMKMHSCRHRHPPMFPNLLAVYL